MGNYTLFSLNSLNIFVIVIAILFVITITLLIIYIVKFKKYENKYNNIWAELYKGNLEEDMKNLIDRNKKTENDCKETQILCSEINGKMIKCIQKVGLVKYNAFEGGNSGLSFALALLDSNNNGVMINSVYNRNFSNIYAKEIEGGSITGNVTTEEDEALRKALNSKSFM